MTERIAVTPNNRYTLIEGRFFHSSKIMKIVNGDTLHVKSNDARIVKITLMATVSRQTVDISQSNPSTSSSSSSNEWSDWPIILDDNMRKFKRIQIFASDANDRLVAKSQEFRIKKQQPTQRCYDVQVVMQPVFDGTVWDGGHGNNTQAMVNTQPKSGVKQPSPSPNVSTKRSFSQTDMSTTPCETTKKDKKELPVPTLEINNKQVTHVLVNEAVTSQLPENINGSNLRLAIAYSPDNNPLNYTVSTDAEPFLMENGIYKASLLLKRSHFEKAGEKDKPKKIKFAVMDSMNHTIHFLSGEVPICESRLASSERKEMVTFSVVNVDAVMERMTKIVQQNKVSHDSAVDTAVVYIVDEDDNVTTQEASQQTEILDDLVELEFSEIIELDTEIGNNILLNLFA